ncbi:MAG: TIGR03790 family protein [Pseudomonadota bacterium]|nr:TIGR03790 family protein [Pseudomonadota bacterium]
MRLLLFFLFILVQFTSVTHVCAQSATSERVSRTTLALIINDDDPHSVEVGRRYQDLRKIPDAHVIHVHLPDPQHNLAPAEFKKLKQEVDAQLPQSIQAILMAWTSPYAVACNSITAAMTLGYNGKACENTCAPTEASPYYNQTTVRPFTDLHVRPSMLLPADAPELAEAVMTRGLQSEFRVAPAGAWFLLTSDKARSSRAPFFPPSGYVSTKKLTISTVKRDSLTDVHDIMIYELGALTVPHLETLRFRPGALADHLTSTGGDLLGTGQMSALRWLDAGATASYGSVSEPCNYWQKFPNSTVLTRRYLLGDTAVEAYWKSVAWPTQGLFIGDPLARPYAH